MCTRLLQPASPHPIHKPSHAPPSTTYTLNLTRFRSLNLFFPPFRPQNLLPWSSLSSCVTTLPLCRTSRVLWSTQHS
jgi:hypothetical protein